MCCGASNSFSLNVLNDSFALNRFLSGDEAISEITDYMHSPTPNYFSRWRVAWICIKAPFEAIFALFTKAIACIARCLCCVKMGRFFTILSKHMERDFIQLDHHWEFGERLLVPATNIHQLCSWDFYKYGSLPTIEIKNKELFAKTYCHQVEIERERKIKFIQLFLTLTKELSKEPDSKSKVNELKREITKGSDSDSSKKMKALVRGIEIYPKNLFFYIHKLKKIAAETQRYENLRMFSPGGVCRGGSYWFIHLFLKTLHLFHDREKHAMAVADRFRSGVPREGAFLQSLCDFASLLDLKYTEYERIQLNDKRKVLRTLEILQPGVYLVVVPYHVLAYVKYSNEIGGLFDLNYGLLKASTDECYDHLYHFYEKKPEEIKEDIESLSEFETLNLSAKECFQQLYDSYTEGELKGENTEFTFSFYQYHAFEAAQSAATA